MSQALKCDRCKICFDPWTTEGEFATIREMTFQNRENWKNHEVNYRDEEIHMCPKCTEEYEAFMGMKKFEAKKMEKDIPGLFRFNIVDPYSDKALKDHLNRWFKVMENANGKKEEK